ncbi:MAG: hypothetical protein M0Z75_04110 [Nitrospiraceae bacterium]|nr:hypothetical protein [Nitrospiraceae bacterium]
MKPDNSEQIQKRVAYYSNLVNAWIQSRMELDKTLITISSAGIGFLVALLSYKVIDGWGMFTVFVMALIAFFLTIWTCIGIFKENSAYIGKLIENPDATSEQSRLNKLDKRAQILFSVAMACVLAIGVMAAISQFENKAKEAQKMSVDKKGTQRKTQDSIAGLGGLNPNVIEKNQSAAPPKTDTNTQKSDNTKK